jgi:hypothetical protein
MYVGSPNQPLTPASLLLCLIPMLGCSSTACSARNNGQSHSRSGRAVPVPDRRRPRKERNLSLRWRNREPRSPPDCRFSHHAASQVRARSKREQLTLACERESGLRGRRGTLPLVSASHKSRSSQTISLVRQSITGSRASSRSS